MKVLKVIPTLDDNRIYQLFLNTLKWENTEREDEANLVLNLERQEYKKSILRKISKNLNKNKELYYLVFFILMIFMIYFCIQNIL